MFTAQIETFVIQFFSNKLNHGHHEFVFGLTSYWGSQNGLGKYIPFYSASFFMQERLIKEFGYAECPYCYWAMARANDHEACKLIFNM